MKGRHLDDRMARLTLNRKQLVIGRPASVKRWMIDVRQPASHYSKAPRQQCFQFETCRAAAALGEQVTQHPGAPGVGTCHSHLSARCYLLRTSGSMVFRAVTLVTEGHHCCESALPHIGIAGVGDDTLAGCVFGT